MGAAVAVFGKGMLAEMVSTKLSGLYRVIRRKDLKSSVPRTAKLCLVLNDEYRPSVYSTAENAMQKAGKPWLSGFIAFDEGVVGPLVRPGTPGCSQCAETRRFAADSDRESRLEQQLSLFRPGVNKRNRSLSRSGLFQMSCLLLSETGKVLEGKPALSQGRIYVMDLKTLTGSLHAFLPDPLCRVCGRLPDDLPESARITLRPSLKVNAYSFRCRSMDELANHLVKDYCDERTGMMNRMNADPLTPFADMLVSLPISTGIEWTAGRAQSYQESKQVAVLEGLERYCGSLPRGKRTHVYNSYQKVRDRALDPQSVGLYSEKQYALPDFPYEPFDADVPIFWVWGYSFLQQRPLLVPRELAYYSTGLAGSFVTEGSNGSALGGSLEEAILHGILEVVERDSFLLTWYAQLPVPRIDPCSIADKEWLLMIDRLQEVAGFELYLFNTTMENGIPSLWVIAKNTRKTGANLICAAGAHLDPVRAAKSAIYEIAGLASYLDHLFEENQEEYVRMIDDPYLVAEMGEHAGLYTVPQTEERLHFLLKSAGPLRKFEEQFQKRERHADLTEDLKDVLQAFRRLKMDVIVVDQSTPETIKNGLHVVKVIIPGMLPMTFGHHLRRLTGLNRVKKVPVELGFAASMLTDQELNPHPHPFL